MFNVKFGQADCAVKAHSKMEVNYIKDFVNIENNFTFILKLNKAINF